jgi:hypothetical protein
MTALTLRANRRPERVQQIIAIIRSPRRLRRVVFEARRGPALWCVVSGNCLLSFEDFVGAARQGQRDSDAEGFGGLEIEE